MIINYFSKEESDFKKFRFSNNKISLREYEDNLVFYSSLGTKRPEYCIGSNKNPTVASEPVFATGGTFGTYVKLPSTMSYDNLLFNSLGSEGSISFYTKANTITQYPKAILKPNSSFPDTLPAGAYSFGFKIKDTSKYANITTTKDLDLDGLKNFLLFSLSPTAFADINIENDTSSNIVIDSVTKNPIEIFEGDTEYGTDLSQYFDVSYTNGVVPSETVTLLSVAGISFKYSYYTCDDGYTKTRLIVTIGNNEPIKLDCELSTTEFTHIELDFDSGVSYFYINGELKSLNILTEEHTSNDSKLVLSGISEDEYYCFDELIIKSSIVNRKSFDLPTTALTKYTTTKPFIDYTFNNILVDDILDVKASFGLSANIKIGNDFYYYSAGSWIKSDGTYKQSSDFFALRTNIARCLNTKVPNNIVLRIFFNSNGSSPAYIEDLQFKRDDAKRFINGTKVSAILAGSVSIEDDDTLDLEDKPLKVSTNLGEYTVEFDYKTLENEITLYKYNDVYYSDSALTTVYDVQYEENLSENGESVTAEITADDGTTEVSADVYIYTELTKDYNLTRDEIVDQLEKSYIEGIEKIEIDKENKLVLISETKGREAWISVSGLGALEIFGKQYMIAQGSDINDGTIDYSNFFEKVRTYGSGSKDNTIVWTVPERQMLLYLQEAMFFYKQYYFGPASVHSCQLQGNAKDGYDIPSVVESASDIVDIIFQPIFPISFYGSNFIDDGAGDDIITLTLANSLMNGSQVNGRFNSSFVTDYYISLMNIENLRQTLGLDAKWDILKNEEGVPKLHIYPSGMSRFTKVSIKYRGIIDENEVIKNPFFIQYVCGKCYIAMGIQADNNGETLQAGDSPINTNGAKLQEIGRQYVENVLKEWRGYSIAGMNFIVG